MLLSLLSIVGLIIAISPSDQAIYSCDPRAGCGCSANPVSINRIVGGESAGSATWSWVVSIVANDGNLCGGSIISDSWILTAAHCVTGYLPSQISVHPGSILLGSGTQRVTVSQMIIHPSYVAANYENDIALLRIFPPLSMNDPNIGSICVPSVSPAILAANEWPEPGTTVVAIGWGKLSEYSNPTTVLQQVTLSTIDYREQSCRSVIHDPRIQFCAGVYGGGKDTCQGDSGGPLMMFTPTRQWLLVGLTSYGEGCARPQFSGVYTRVAFYENWIRSNTDNSVRFISSAHANTVQILPWSLLLCISLILMF